MALATLATPTPRLRPVQHPLGPPLELASKSVALQLSPICSELQYIRRIASYL